MDGLLRTTKISLKLKNSIKKTIIKNKLKAFKRILNKSEGLLLWESLLKNL